RLSTDPTFRLIGSPKRWDRSAALTSTLHWFETELLTRQENLVGLMAVNRDVIGRAEMFDRVDHMVLDMIPARARCMGSKKVVPITGTSSRSATNHRFCSTITATAWRRSCARV